MLRILFTLVIALYIAGSAAAIDTEYLWTGASGGNTWNNSGNWQLLHDAQDQGFPQFGDTALFNMDAIVGNGEVSFIEVSSAATLTVAADQEVAVRGTIDGQLVHGVIGNQGKLTFAADSNDGQRNEVPDTQIRIDGDVTLVGGGEVVFNGSATGFGGSGTLTNIDNRLRGNGYLNVDMINQGTIRAESGTLYVGSGIVIDGGPSVATVSKFVKINPTSTYLRTAKELEVDETTIFPGITDSEAIDLTTVLYGISIEPGDTIALQRWGDFTFSDSDAQGSGPHGNLTLRGLWGVFSRSDELLSDEERNNFDRTVSVTPVKRVVDAVQAQFNSNLSPIDTAADPYGELPGEVQPTNIDEDFIIGFEETGQAALYSATPLSITIPPEVQYLFAGAGDIQWYDNRDLDGNFRLLIARDFAGSGRVEIASDGILNLNGGVVRGGVVFGEPGGMHQWGTFRNLTTTGVLTQVADTETRLEGTITNQGTLTFAADSNDGQRNEAPDTQYRIDGDVTLTGGGEVVFNGSATGFGGSGTLTNVDNLIRGNGLINVDVVNQDIIRAEGGTLSLNPGVLVDNDTATGRVEIASDGILNLNGGVIRGGIVDGEPGGMHQWGTFRNLTTTGVLTQVADTETRLEGTITNQGKLTFAADSNDGQRNEAPDTQYRIDGDVTLTGGGEVVFNGSATGFGGSGTLTNVDNLIRGNGLINVDVVNQDIIRAEGGTLFLNSGVLVDNNAVTGRVEIASDGILNLNGGVIRGGIVDGEPGGMHQWGTFRNLTTTGVLTQVADTETRLEGTITNQGTLTFAADSNDGQRNEAPDTQYRIDGDVTLTGGGEVVFNGSATGFGGSGTLTNVNNILRGNGSINVDIVNGGTIRAEAGPLFLNSGVLVDNGSTGAVEIASDGILNLNGGVIRGGVVVGEPGGMHQGGTFRNLTTTGVLTQVADTETRLEGTIINQGTLTFAADSNDGQRNEAPDTQYRIDGDVTLTGGGEVVFNGSATGFGGSGTLTNVDNLIRGNGLINVDVVNQDTLRAEGILQLANLVLEPTSNLEAVVTPVPEINSYQSLGSVQLGGSLVPIVADGFVPSVGQTFDILTAPGVISGTFLQNSLSSISGGKLITWSVLYDTTTVSLVVAAVGAIPGDFDLDGDVDGRDFLLWQRGGSPNPLSASDLADWQTHYSQTATSANPISAIPEPNTLSILIVVCYRLCGIRRPRKCK